MTARAWIGLGVAWLTACGKDVQLGVGPDAPPVVEDSPPGVFTPGTYGLAFLDPIDVNCEGILAGREDSFSTITRASANLVDGSVTLAMPSATTLSISGTTIMTAFGQATIDLVLNPGTAPEMIWDTRIARDFGSGPNGTMQVARFFGVDSATAMAPAIEAAVSLRYEASALDGCFVTLGAALASQ